MADRKFLIGRGRDCDVIFADASISRKQAELSIAEDGSMILTDLGSSFGTSVVGAEGKPTSSQLLPSDDVMLGQFLTPASAILQAIRQKFPPPDMPQLGSGTTSKPWAVGGNLMRCSCGAVKQVGKVCGECGA